MLLQHCKRWRHRCGILLLLTQRLRQSAAQRPGSLCFLPCLCPLMLLLSSCSCSSRSCQAVKHRAYCLRVLHQLGTYALEAGQQGGAEGLHSALLRLRQCVQQRLLDRSCTADRRTGT